MNDFKPISASQHDLRPLPAGDDVAIPLDGNAVCLQTSTYKERLQRRRVYVSDINRLSIECDCHDRCLEYQSSTVSPVAGSRLTPKRRPHDYAL